MFLAEDDVREMTGLTRYSSQIKWLQANGVPFIENAKGRPILHHSMKERVKNREELSVACFASEMNRRISRNIGKVHRGPGVYALYLKKKVMYVGQTKNVIRRIGEHAANKDFDEYRYIKCSESELLEMEAAVISALRPILNIHKNEHRVNENA